MTIDPTVLGAATAFAANAHADQRRKRAAGDDRPAVPYISHLLAVSGLVIEDGGDTDEAIAGLLHDYLEDIDSAGGEELEARFGARVRGIVEACTGPKKEEPGMAEFRVRKQIYLDRLSPRRPGRPLLLSIQVRRRTAVGEGPIRASSDGSSSSSASVSR